MSDFLTYNPNCESCRDLAAQVREEIKLLDERLKDMEDSRDFWRDQFTKLAEEVGR